ncbi:hypothetical protein G7046_g6442 [Stylonectria norvegica]|nr:hypothetical protein G7046_g6442 [Stylonectria norvegica]
MTPNMDTIFVVVLVCRPLFIASSKVPGEVTQEVGMGFINMIQPNFQLLFLQLRNGRASVKLDMDFTMLWRGENDGLSWADEYSLTNKVPALECVAHLWEKPSIRGSLCSLAIVGHMAHEDRAPGSCMVYHLPELVVSQSSTVYWMQYGHDQDISKHQPLRVNPFAIVYVSEKVAVRVVVKTISEELERALPMGPSKRPCYDSVRVCAVVDSEMDAHFMRSVGGLLAFYALRYWETKWKSVADERLWNLPSRVLSSVLNCCFFFALDGAAWGEDEKLEEKTDIIFPDSLTFIGVRTLLSFN